MTNARDELIEHVEGREVEFVRVLYGAEYYEPQEAIEGRLDDVLSKLDFEYDAGYGAQYLTGYIWYKDGTWSERCEYDGSEWWEYKSRPPINNGRQLSIIDLAFNRLHFIIKPLINRF